MEIGEPTRIWEIEPLEDPVPSEPAPEREPAYTPEEEPTYVEP